MKRFVIALTLVAVAFALTRGQERRGHPAAAEIVALEERAYEAWKNKDRRFFEEHMAEDGQYLDANGGGRESSVRAGHHGQRLCGERLRAGQA